MKPVKAKVVAVKAVKEVEPIEADGPAPEPTETEIAIEKFGARLFNMKHIDAVILARDYIWPLFRRLAEASGDHEEMLGDHDEQLEELSEQLEDLGGGDADALEAAKEIIIEFAQLLDEVMVTAGFYAVVNGVGLKATDKVPEALRAKYEAIGPRTVEVVSAIQGAIEAAASADEGDEGDDGDDGDEGDEDEEGDESDEPTNPGLDPNIPNLDAPSGTDAVADEVIANAVPDAVAADAVAAVADAEKTGGSDAA